MHRSVAVLVAFGLFCTVVPAPAEVAVVDLGKQIDTGRGPAITNVDSFLTEAGVAFARTLLRTGKGAGGYYTGLSLDLTKTPTGSVDASLPGTVLRFTARYFQGAGNTSPYGDAPIAAQLRDAHGRTVNLDILYGPRPVARYPEWVTCVADVRLEAAPAFDYARVTGVAFSGTDWAGKGGDFVDIRYLAFITPDAPTACVSFADARSKPDGTAVKLLGLASTAKSPDAVFTIEDYWRNVAIPVREPAGRPAIQAAPQGRMVMVTGTIETDPTSRSRYVSAKWWAYYGAEPAAELLKPKGKMAVRCAELAAASGDSGARFLRYEVEVTGRVAGAEPARCLVFLADPASDTGRPSVAMSTDAIPSWQRPAFSRGDLVTVTGVCCLTSGPRDTWQPLVRVRNRQDIRFQFAADNQPKTIRVFVLSCDPRCPAFGNKRTHEVCHWSDPRALATQFIAAISESSNGWARYEIVRWHDADYYPANTDGFHYTPDEYVRAFRNRDRVAMRKEGADVVRVFTDKTYPHNQPKSIVELVASGEVDEVFFFSPVGAFGTWEGMMAGPSPFFINGATYQLPEAKRNFAAHGFNYERGVDCMIEDFCHRAECTMSRVYQAKDLWLPTAPPSNNWDAFRMYDKRGAGQAACGICHYAPNSASDYDWGNSTPVLSTCDDWLFNWPDLQGMAAQRSVTSAEWGGGAMDKHHIWWLNHVPKAAGVGPDGKQNNWWKYICDYNAHVH